MACHTHVQCTSLMSDQSYLIIMDNYTYRVQKQTIATLNTDVKTPAESRIEIIIEKHLQYIREYILCLLVICDRS